MNTRSPQVDRAIVKLVRKRPFQSEALMLLTCVDIRPEALLKMKKSDLKDDYILFRKEIKKDRSKGTVEDTKIYHTPEIIRALGRLDRQYKRKGHQKYRFIPWLIFLIPVEIIMYIFLKIIKNKNITNILKKPIIIY